jgi:hypothetical protein
VIDADALHRAAERVGTEYGTPAMDELAEAAAEFLGELTLTDEDGTPFEAHGPSLGYGVMIGYLAAREEAINAPLTHAEALQVANRALDRLQRDE